MDLSASIVPAGFSPTGAVDMHTLRELFGHELAKYVERMWDQLHKVQVWLRIVREVLRGLGRRTLVDE